MCISSPKLGCSIVLFCIIDYLWFVYATNRHVGCAKQQCHYWHYYVSMMNWAAEIKRSGLKPYQNYVSSKEAMWSYRPYPTITPIHSSCTQHRSKATTHCWYFINSWSIINSHAEVAFARLISNSTSPAVDFRGEGSPLSTGDAAMFKMITSFYTTLTIPVLVVLVIVFHFLIFFYSCCGVLSPKLPSGICFPY